ncbi:MAG: hypothetical protein KDK54_09465 [Leptospiraceae bacterium]|nr:hypothetical protein [Leptospiraceae bacterium]
MTALKRSILLLAFLSAFAIIGQQSKKPIPSTKTVDKASEVIDSVITTKDTVQPVKREETVTTTTTTTTTDENGNVTATDKSTTSNTTSTTPAETTTSGTTTGATTTTPPASNTAATQPQPGTGKTALYVNFKTSFELLPTDDLSTVDYVEYKINDSEYMKYTGPITLSKEGSTTIAYRAIDKVGNKENPTLLYLVVDNTPPTAVIKPSQPLYVDKSTGFTSPNNTFTITAEDVAAGVKEIVYSVDNEPNKTYEGPIKIEKPGFHSVTYYAVDNAGNSSQPQNYLVNIDAGKPTVDITESLPYVKVGDKSFARKGTLFKLSAKDNESGISKILYKRDTDTEFSPYVEELTFDTPGEHKLEAKSIDNVGNESDVKAISFFYDVQAPKTSIKAIPSNN